MISGREPGSVSVESAIQAEDGQVYAVEINPEAAGLIEEMPENLQ